MIADVHKPLLGADILHHFDLLVELTNEKLVDTNTHLSINGILVHDTPSTITVPTHIHAHNDTTLLSEFHELTQVHNY